MRCSVLVVGLFLSLGLGNAIRCDGDAPDQIVVPVPRVLFQVDVPEPEPLPSGEPAVRGGGSSFYDNDPSFPLPAPTTQPRSGTPGDWSEASPGEERVSEVIRAHWVNLNREGELLGRISVFDEENQLVPISDLQLRFVREGNTLATSRTDTNGRFVVSTLRPGVYTLIADGPNGFLGYSLEVLSFAEAERRVGGNPMRLVQLEQAEASLEIDAAAVPPTFVTLKQIVRQYYPEIRLHDVAEAAYEPELRRDEREEATGAGTPAGSARRRGVEQLQRELPRSRDATSLRAHEVALLPGGRMLGRLHGIDRLTGRPKLIEEVNVFLLQEDMVVDQVPVDRYGVFEVRDLQPGAYALVAAGRDGFGAVGFQLVQVALGLNARTGPREDPFPWALHRSRPLPARLVQLGGQNEVPFPFAMALIDDPRDVRTAFSADGVPAPLAGGMMGGAPPAPMGSPGGAPGPGGGAPGGFSSGGGALSALAFAGLAGLAGAGGGSSPVIVSPFSPTETPDMIASPPPSHQGTGDLRTNDNPNVDASTAHTSDRL